MHAFTKHADDDDAACYLSGFRSLEKFKIINIQRGMACIVVELVKGTLYASAWK